MQTITLTDLELVTVRIALRQRADRENGLADSQYALVSSDQPVHVSAQYVEWGDHYRAQATATRALMDRITGTPTPANNPVFHEF